MPGAVSEPCFSHVFEALLGMGMQNLETFQQDTIELLTELTSDWDTGLDGGITSSTAIVHDLGFESLDVVYLVTAIEQKYGRRDLPFEKLLMVDGRYVDDLTVTQIAAFLHEHLGSQVAP
jgi:acyl carrier protein